MFRSLFAFFLALTFAAAPPADAGPWARDEGKQFISYSSEMSVTDDWHSVYYEKGLKNRLTIGLDSGVNRYGEGGALVFLRVPLRTVDRPPVALEFALGGHKDIDVSGMAWRLHLSTGRGVGFAKKSGWIVGEISHTVRSGASGYSKAEATLGVHQSDRLILLTQFTLERSTTGTFSSRLAPGLAWKSEKGGHILFSGILRSNGAAPMFKFGFWRSF